MSAIEAVERALRGLIGKHDLPGHIVISGTGRAGTTFLVELFTTLGMDTGFSDTASSDSYFPKANAGLERSLLDPDAPQIVKNPYFCDQVDAAVAAGIPISHVIIPVRRFEEAAASRIHVQQRTTGHQDGPAVAGGLWGTVTASEQLPILRQKFSSLVEALVRNDIPMTFLAFPRLTGDADYLFDKLSPLLPRVSKKEFVTAFRARARPEVVHNFR